MMAISLFTIYLLFPNPVPLYNSSSADLQEETEHVPITASQVVQECAPTLLYGFTVDSLIVIEDKIKRNQSIGSILSGHNVSHESINRLEHASKKVFDVRKLAINHKYTLICRPDSMLTASAFVYEQNAAEYVVFNLHDSVSIEKKRKKVTVVEKRAAGLIKNNLAITMSNLGLSPALTNDFVDIFAWEIDFFRLHKGDRFKLIYEDRLVEGKSVGPGKIKGVYFEHMGTPLYAFQFDQGNGIDYFDENGNSLRKSLLRYPLDFTRISSRYSGRRFHPVQKRWKAHRGTDFAAPRGTPIRAVGDGVVLEARYQKFNGNYVKIKHNATYTTQYLHMSKIHTAVKKGGRVRRGDVIGYVGSTGLARGNHLCYRFWKNGVQVDALKVDLPPSTPITPENLFEFDATKIALMRKLDLLPFAKDPAPVIARSR